jgi:SAM-dependent methyltransferase
MLPNPESVVVTESSSTYFANNGAAYEWFLGRWSRRLADPLITFANFAATGDLLDVGCGTGSLAFAMADRWPERRVVGIDAAAEYVTFARKRALGTTPIFDIGDATDLPYPDRSFAGSGAQLILNFVSDPLAALAEVRRVTVPGGVVVAAVWDFRGGLVYQRIFWDTAAGIDPRAGAARDRLFSTPLALPGGLVELFDQAGLDQIQQSSITVRMEYAAFSDYWQPLLGGQGPVGTYLVGLEPDLRKRIEEAIRMAYYSGGPDGERSMTATAWAVRAVVP